ncbi:MAG: DUF4230 domain-containing protein [Anaerolineae bacterium]|nr:DUF4230 domain-containing protein [Anaerolineae bacterium]
MSERKDLDIRPAPPPIIEERPAPMREGRDAQPEGPRRGCLERSLLYSTSCAVLIILILTGGVLLGVELITDALENVAESVSDVFDNDDTVEINIGPIIQAFQEQAFLETVRQNQQFDANARDNIRLGGVIPSPISREVDLRAYITVTAGVDLQRMTNEDFVTDETTNTLTIYLPPPQIKDCIFDIENSRFEYNTYCSAVARCRDLQSHVQEEAMAAAATQGIENTLEMARTNAQDQIRELVTQSGFTGRLLIEERGEPLHPVAVDGTCYTYYPEPPASAE